MFPLAAQSVYARLVVKKAAARTDRFQESTKNYFPYYDIGEKLTESNPLDYTVDNLPSTVYSLPKGSVYDKITFLPHDLPDFRVVPVAGSTKRPSIVNASMNTSAPSAPAIVKTGPPTTFANRGNKPYPVFKTSAAAGNTSSIGDTSDTDVEGLLELGTSPLTLDAAAVKRFLGTDYTAVEITLADGSIHHNDRRTKDSVMANASQYLEVPTATVQAVLSAKNKHMNRDTLKVGILYALIASMNDTIAARVSDNVAKNLAALINNAVDRV